MEDDILHLVNQHYVQLVAHRRRSDEKENPEKYRLWRIAAIIEVDCIDEKLDREEVKSCVAKNQRSD